MKEREEREEEGKICEASNAQAKISKKKDRGGAKQIQQSDLNENREEQPLNRLTHHPVVNQPPGSSTVTRRQETSNDVVANPVTNQASRGDFLALLKQMLKIQERMDSALDSIYLITTD